MNNCFFSNRSARRAARGFTLVEMLVVIGIIVLLIGLLLPMISRAYRNAERSRVSGDLQAISAALEAYKQDMGQYPPVPVGNDGARILCQALLGPGPVGNGSGNGDGADGYGFRTRLPIDPATGQFSANGVHQSKIYGPYMPPDRIKVGDPTNPSLANPNLMTVVFIDRYRHPILYFPANAGKPNIHLPGGYVAASDKSLYDANDNLSYFTDIKKIQFLLGDNNPADGMISGSETAATTGPFLLWSCGPDEIFGPDDVTPNGLGKLAKVDDVTNFRD